MTKEELDKLIAELKKQGVDPLKKGIDHKNHTFDGKVPTIKPVPMKKIRKGTQKGG